MESNTRLVNARTIGAPSHHEGIGNALRSAFDSSYGLPAEFANLLKKLDR